MTESNPHEKLLVFLLRLGAVMTLSAFGAIFLTVETMARVHELIGVGEFPATPITDYLTRSLSAMYGFHGGLLLLVSTDVKRFRRIVAYVAFMNIAFGVMLIGIDLHAGIPAWWTWVEGPSVILFGLVFLYLLRRI